jgi:hypothetical protein
LVLLDVAVISWAVVAVRGALLRLLGGFRGVVVVVTVVGLDVLVFLGLTPLLGLAAVGVNLSMAAACCSDEKVVVVGRRAALA